MGTYLSFFLFGGQFPGEDIIPRLYTAHVLLIPGVFLALITVHLILVWYQKHTQYPLPGRTEKNAVGYPFFPVYTAKAGGFFFITFGVTTLLSAFVAINQIWLFGPYNPGEISAGSQPDWYMGFLEGSLRMFPNWETHLLGFTVPWNVIGPALIIPGLLFTPMAIYPFLERWVTGDNAEHHVLDRPRNVPTRTGLGVLALTTWLILLAGGANDILAVTFHLSINTITNSFRVLIFVLPPLAYVVTKRICLGLQRRDRELVLHGRETGRIVRLPHGEMIEVHEPISEVRKWELTQHLVREPYQVGPVDRRQRRAPAQADVRQGPGPGVPVLLRGPGRAADAGRGPRAGVQRPSLIPRPPARSASSREPPATSAAGWCPSCWLPGTGCGSWPVVRRACATTRGPARSRSWRPTPPTRSPCAGRWPASTSPTT